MHRTFIIGAIMKIAVMGGAGYIGSHTIIELYKAGHSVVVVDNLVNSSDESLRRVAELVGSPIPFVKADVRDAAAMDKIFSENKFDACIHFAGLNPLCRSQGCRRIRREAARILRKQHERYIRVAPYHA